MAGSKQLVLRLVLLWVACILGEEGKDLDGAEANGKLEIIKQIKKINEDGSYTIGYEADDGSFKIESRDVLGNIKGTYGYIDEHGEIKRVSYSSTNSTQQAFEKPPEVQEEHSVVQRIPKVLKSGNSTTRRPIIVYPNLTTPGTPTSTSNIQSIPRRRITTSTTSTPSTEKSNLFSTAAPARILIQSRPLLRSTGTNQEQVKNQPESPQIARPEVTKGTTDNPIFRRVQLKNTLLDSETTSAKPVTEEPEVKSNLLRRQLNPDKVPFDPRQHAINLQQAVGHDHVDVYSASLTTGTPRPLFTTTSRPRLISSTTIRPTVRFAPYNRLRANQVVPQAEETTTGASVEIPRVTTPAPVPVVQIPANRGEEQDQFVAVRHPFHRGTILVPISHFHQRPEVQMQEPREIPPQYLVTKDQYLREVQPTASPEPQEAPVYIRRVPPPPHLRPMPVQVDENGFIREVPRYPPPVVPVPQRSRYQEALQQEIDQIKPPVSTKDFQKLLEQLIIRQSRLEQISSLTRQPELFRPRLRAVYPTQMVPVVFRHHEMQQTGPVQFIQTGEASRERPYITLNPVQQSHPQQPQGVLVRPQEALYYQDPRYQEEIYTQTPESYVPNKRVARLLTPSVESQKEGKENEEYLPVDVREMLLLRMLQLAINPALPLDENEMSAVTHQPVESSSKKEVRNVEILGEEEDPKKIQNRIKRFL